MSKQRVTPPEIVAAVIVVGLIAAIFGPLFRPPSQQGQDWRYCISNLKQIGLALDQYAEDNDNRLPGVTNAPQGRSTWRMALYPYTKRTSLFHCPAHLAGAVGADGLASDYAASASRNGAFSLVSEKPRALANFATPAKTIAIVEVAGTNRADFNIDGSAGVNHLWAGHWGSGNYVFADGHAKSLHPPDTYRVDVSGKVIENQWDRDSKKPLSANGQALLRRAQTEFR